MTRLFLRRMLQLPVILLAIYTLTFTLTWLIPGSPLEKAEARQPPPGGHGGDAGSVSTG